MADNKEKKKIEPVNIGKVEIKKQTLGGRLKKVFLGDNLKNAFRYSVKNVLVPEAKRAIMSTLISGVEKVFYGENKAPYDNRSPYNQTRSTYVRYDKAQTRRYDDIQQNRYDNPTYARDTSYTRIEDFTYATWDEALLVIEQLENYLVTYPFVTIQDFCELIKVQSNFNDCNYGWSNINGARPVPCSGGRYYIQMPKPEPINIIR